MNDEGKKVFSLGHMVSFRSARKLSSYLVWAKLYPVERKVGSCKYNCNRCQKCQSISETDTFTCSNDGNTYKINHLTVTKNAYFTLLHVRNALNSM